jgi:hypothetical protein
MPNKEHVKKMKLKDFKIDPESEEFFWEELEGIEYDASMKKLLKDLFHPNGKKNEVDSASDKDWSNLFVAMNKARFRTKLRRDREWSKNGQPIQHRRVKEIAERRKASQVSERLANDPRDL